jgi:transcriptional regulator with XRE-family HTH domain
MYPRRGRAPGLLVELVARAFCSGASFSHKSKKGVAAMSKAETRAFGREVRRRRLEQGLTQERLAERAGLTSSCVVRTEGGHRNLSLSTIAQLAQGLGVSVAELLPGYEGLSTHAAKFARRFEAIEDHAVKGAVVHLLRTLSRKARKPR